MRLRRFSPRWRLSTLSLTLHYENRSSQSSRLVQDAVHQLIRSSGVPREWDRGFNPPIESSKNYIVCLQNILSKPRSYVHYIPNFIQENVRNCTLISLFASASGDFVLQTPYRGFAPGPHWKTSVPWTSWPGPHGASGYTYDTQ